MSPIQTQHHLRQLSRIVLISFMLVALTLVFWMLRAGTILVREDNPRQVVAQQQIQRGQILDSNGTILAESVPVDKIMVRSYPLNGSGPIVGYYSLRHGSSGIEESYDATLRGSNISDGTLFWQNLLHQPQVGHAVQLTLDATLQAAADRLLGDQHGALVLLSLPDARILAVASHPGYDPNQLDDTFDALMADDSAPLLNRATQGQYQPGRVLQPFVMATAVDQNLITFDEVVTRATRPVAIGETVLQCDSAPPQAANWADVLRLHCPGPLADLGAMAGTPFILSALTNFGLTTQPALPLAVPEETAVTIIDPALAALGQENLTVTPMQVALALAALGGDGTVPQPQVVTAVQDPTGNWLPVTPETEPLATAVAPTTATRLRRILSETNDTLENFVLSVAGPGGATNAWYLALTPATNPTHAIVIVLEDQTSTENAVVIGRAVLAEMRRE